jgi:hypothetical protein
MRPFSPRSPTRAQPWGSKEDYNTVRPHSALGNLPPAIFAKLSVPGMQRDGALRYVEGSAPAPLHHRANKAQMKPGLSSLADEIRGSAQAKFKSAQEALPFRNEAGLRRSSS